MDKKTGMLLGAVAGLATMGAAHAAPLPGANAAEALNTSSYAELLAPVSNAVALVKADDAARAQSSESNMQLVDYYVGRPAAHHHHHHHHHHQAYNYHHHHHHHHHQAAVVGVPGVGVVIGTH